MDSTEHIERRILWTAERICRTQTFLHTVKMKKGKSRLRLLERTVPVGLLAQLACHVQEPMEAAILVYIPKYIRNWKKEIQKHFGNDIVFLIDGVWNFLSALEAEEYTKLDAHTRDMKTIALCVIIEQLVRELANPELDEEGKAFLCQVADWKMSYLIYTNSELLHSLRHVIQNCMHQERITIDDILQNKIEESECDDQED